jgi:hypothetical protein
VQNLLKAAFQLKLSPQRSFSLPPCQRELHTLCTCKPLPNGKLLQHVEALVRPTDDSNTDDNMFQMVLCFSIISPHLVYITSQGRYYTHSTHVYPATQGLKPMDVCTESSSPFSYITHPSTFSVHGTQALRLFFKHLS